jgi:pimeloyl-ACP methyl ester carboxylesterase
MKPRIERSFWTALLALAALGLAASGCVTQNMAARMITTAPNREYTPEQPEKLTEFWDYFKDGQSSPFVYLKVKTGPPDAMLSLVELPAGDYHVKFISGIRTNWENKKFLTMKFQSETNRAFKPLKEPATIVILHGYMMYKETMAPWAAELAQAGYRVVLVDLRGHGQSTGDQATYGKYETKDLMQMLDYLKALRLCDDKVGVLGLSYGATIALHWAAADPRVQAVVAIAPYNNPEDAAQRLAKELKIPVSTNVLRAALKIAAKRLDLNWADWSGDAAVKKLKEPVLFIGGGHDRICLPADLETMKKDAPAGSKVVMVPDVNHFVLGFLLHLLADPVKAWYAEHLEGQTVNGQGHIAMGDGKGNANGGKTPKP